MDIPKIKEGIITMAQKINSMLQLIEKGFMEHKVEFLTDAMKDEDAINDLEKSLTASLFELSRATPDKRELARLGEAIQELERIGDEGANIIERIEIKISEKLLFSEKGVEQFNEVYSVMKLSIDMMIICLKTNDAAIRERIINNGFHVKELVERFRTEYAERMLSGLSGPQAANMYFDMLDFVGNIARHCSNVVKVL